MGWKVRHPLSCFRIVLSITFREQIAFVDAGGRFLVVLGGMPKDENSWKKTTTAAYKAMDEQQQGMRLTCDPCKKKTPENYCKPCHNRRGDFRAVSVGLSFGGGQRVSLQIRYLMRISPFSQHPQMLRQHKANSPGLVALITNHSIFRIAGIGRG